MVRMSRRQVRLAGIALAVGLLLAGEVRGQGLVEYRVLATSKTSTLEKEMNEAADAGYVFAAVMGGETAFGGNESVVVMQKDADPEVFEYKLLATNRTSTMQKEIQAAAAVGYEYVGQTVFETLFGGREVVVIMQRERRGEHVAQHEYMLVATSRTSTLQKELAQAGQRGYEVLGLTVGRTAMGGAELVAIMRRDVAR
jgi:hypothetical protein